MKDIYKLEKHGWSIEKDDYNRYLFTKDNKTIAIDPKIIQGGYTSVFDEVTGQSVGREYVEPWSIEEVRTYLEKSVV